MNANTFIFSNDTPDKFYRHIAFWIVWLCYLVTLALFTENFSNGNVALQTGVKNLFLRSLFEVILEVAFVYLTLYFFLPRFYQRGKKIVFYAITCINCFLLFFAFYLIQVKTSEDLLINIWFSLGNFIGIGPVFICLFFISIKMMKQYYLKTEERALAEKEKTSAEIKYLKAQIHPHFLFNTLNNIYSFTLSQSEKTKELVMKLHDTLYYMINECNENVVPLEKEITLLKNYISLETIRYGNALKMEMQVNGNSENKMIAPLLLLPFVENSFKHGASKMLQHPWIKLNIEIGETILLFNISNSKPLQAVPFNGKSGIGLKNVQKRLNLLYPKEHSLEIQATDDLFIISLSVPLAVMPGENDQAHSYSYVPNLKTFSYAR